MIFHNILTNFLLLLVLFILGQGSVLLQHEISWAFYRRGWGGSVKCTEITVHPTSVWHKIWLSGRTDQPLCNHKLCHPLLARLYSIPVTSGDCCILPFAFWICKSKLGNLDTGHLPSITFIISCSHRHTSDPYRYGADVSGSIKRSDRLYICYVYFKVTRKLPSETKWQNANEILKAELNGHQRTNTNTKRGNCEGHANLQLFLS